MSTQAPRQGPRSSRARGLEPRIHVLLISQRMDRTGAPAQLVTLLPGLREQLGAKVTLLCGSTGPLRPAAGAHVDRVLVEPKPLRALRRAERAAPAPIARLLRRVRVALLRLIVGHVDVAYVNSLISTELASGFDHVPMVLHVHELGHFARSFGDAAQQLMRRAAVVLVPSRPARDWVIDCGIQPARVRVLPGAVPPSAFVAPPPELVAAVRGQTGIEEGVPVVTSVGWVGRLKGSDRFIEVAAQVAERLGRRVRFLWVGGGSDTDEERRFASEVSERGLDDVILTISSVDDLRPVYAISDLVLLASREESLSLVALESAAQATAVVCFPGAGGPDVLAEEGIVIRPTNEGLGGVVDEVQGLLGDPSAREALSHRARDAVRELHAAGDGRTVLCSVLTAAMRERRDPTEGRSSLAG